MATPKFTLASISIRDFRGIHELDLELDARASTVLIGPNNAGKSTVLDAFALALGAPKFSKFAPSEEDCWQPQSGTRATEFQITIRFEPTDDGALPAVKGGIGDPVDVHGILCVGTSDGDLNRMLIDKDDSPIVLAAGTPISKAKQDAYRGFGLTSRRYARPMAIYQWMPSTWYLDAKTLTPSLYEWKSGPLQRLLSKYKEDLLTTKWQTRSGRDMPDALHQAHDFLAKQALPSPFWEKLSKALITRFQTYLGRNAGVSITPGLNPIDEWIASEFRMMVSGNPNLPSVEARRMGDGWQSLLRLAAMEAIPDLDADERTATVLLEEPESYLHPHLRRRLRRSLQKLQDRGYQVIVATHAPEMISFTEEQKVVRLTMTSMGTEKHEYTTGSAAAALRQEEKLTERGNHEMVFANVAVLAEGKDDVFALRLGLEKTNVDCDAESISIVNCGSVGNLPDYAEVCRALGIPWVGVHDVDLDPASGKTKVNTAAAVAKLSALKGPKDATQGWDNDLEDVLGCATGKATPDWIDAKYGTESWTNMQGVATLKKYCAVITAIDSHIKAVT